MCCGKKSSGRRSAGKSGRMLRGERLKKWLEDRKIKLKKN